MFNIQNSRWRFLVAVVILMSDTPLQAQVTSYSVESDITGGVAMLHFKDNELVTPKKRNRNGTGDEVILNAYFLFAVKTPGLKIKTGIGYAERNIYMNKSGIGDFFLALIPFASPERDSFKVRRVQLQSKYLNVPVGFSFDMTNGPQRVHFIASLQLNAGLAMYKNARVDFDEYYLVPTSAERAETERAYENTVAGFTLGIQPRADLQVRIYKGAGINLGLIPFMFYVKSWNKKLATNHFSFASVIGAYYKF